MAPSTPGTYCLALRASATKSLDLPGLDLIHLPSPAQKLRNEKMQGAQGMLESGFFQRKPESFPGLPRPSLMLRHGTRTPQCGRTKNYILRAHQGGICDPLSWVL